MDHRTTADDASPNGHPGTEAPCLGNMTKGVRDNAKDICDIWNQNPMRRHEFGAPEIFDIREAVYGLKALLDEYDRRNAPTLVYKR